ncbi:replicative DNA helicase [Mycolicibacterium novocastrense]|uniref:Replicative DNA helicase n=1 Tax=Mycolicibacterium novocastrense TaxID=59813 RepID=A0AAW5SHF2_MYCNV|nr:replicative DNA helicase [Mycolicibacterium novocastrense]MCV7023654.1 replicative DNA helicase [Mycolicibacterium novocastrense]GAT07701.1 replicative DNA helicase [Mycolicibacterium novocastrense]
MTEITERPPRTTRPRHPSRSDAAPPDDYGRQPPHDAAAEQSVLGGMLLSKDAIADVVEKLRPDDFYRPAHRSVYDAVLDLYGRGEPADPVTVAAELDRRGMLQRIGGAPYLHTLIATVPTAANSGYYASIVAEKALLRRLVEAGTRVVQYGYAGAEGAEVEEVVDRAQAEVYDATQRRASDDFVALDDLLQPTLDEIDAISSGGGRGSGVPTGFPELDEVTTGLHGGQMVIVAARPGVGKALALDTPLPTPTGWTTMGRVEPGDELLDAAGRPTRVVAATDVLHGRPCYELTFSDGTRIVADAEHQWPTPSGVRTTAQIWREMARAGTVRLISGARLQDATPASNSLAHAPMDRAALPPPASPPAPYGPYGSLVQVLASVTEQVAARRQRWRIPGAVRHAIVAVRRVSSVPVRCVQVANADHLYLAGPGAVPTHNSTLALDFMRSCSIKHDLPSVVFSLEMSKSEIVMRLLSAEAKVKLQSMRSGRMSDDDWVQLGHCMARLNERPLFIDDSPNLTMMEIRAKARRLHQRVGLKLIVVDYLQLLTSGKRYESRQQEVSDFSRNLKLLAKELDVPVVAISQLNRGPEQRSDKKPMLSDLRESGSQEQDADIVILLHRPDAFERDDPRGGEADLILAKHRNGPTKTITVAHQLHLSRFSPMAHMGDYQ